MKAAKGGKYWMLVLIICGLVGSAVGVCMNSVGVFYTVVAEDLDVLRGSFALHATLGVLAAALSQVFAPAILKRFSLKPVLWCCVLVSAAATVGMAFSRQLIIFHILGIIRGFGAGIYGLVPVTMIIGNWFYKKQGLATSLALSCSGLVGAVFSPLLTWSIEHFGWEKSFLVMAAGVLVLALPALCSRISLTPAEMGYLPYGMKESDEAVAAGNSAATTTSNETAKATQEKAPASAPASPKIPGGRLAFGLGCLLFMCAYSFLYSLISATAQHFPGMALEVGLTASVGAAMLSCSMIGNICTKLLLGTISDLMTPVKACMIMIGVCIVSLLIIIGVYAGAPGFLLYFASFIYGSNFAVGAVGIPLLIRRFYGNENYGPVFGVVGACGNAGNAVALSTIGYLYDFTGSYRYALYIGIGLSIYGAIQLLVIKGIVSRKKKQLGIPENN